MTAAQSKENGSSALDDPVNCTTANEVLWSTTNVGEATPDILAPLDWSVWGEPTTMCFLRTLNSLGVLSARETVFEDRPEAMSAVPFYGRQAVNLTLVSNLVGRIPGMTSAEFLRDVVGAVPEGHVEPATAWGRLPVTLAKTVKSARAAHRNTVSASTETAVWWQQKVLGTGGGEPARPADPLALLQEAAARFDKLETTHFMNRQLMSIPQAAVAKTAAQAGREELSRSVFAGYGGVAETAMADDAWLLARDQLDMDEFIRRYGFHGPNEGNVYTTSWREDQEPIKFLMAASRRATRRPRDREGATIAKRKEAEAELLAALPRQKRATLRWMARWGGGLVRDLETTKAAFLQALDVCRFAARHLGADLTRTGALDQVDDVFFLTIPELAALKAGELKDARALVAGRRQERERYRLVELPEVWRGLPTPVAIDQGGAEAGADEEVKGIPIGGGVVVGRARVVVDPNQEIDIDDGDILVCRITDPSWTLLMSLSSALVIDMGGPASHGAIVSRELGITCVIGTGNGTRVITDGETIEVDGETGVVRRLPAA